jgi:hypothetical protein
MNDDRAFDLILDQALKFLTSGLSREACLRRFPEHAARLAPLLSAAEAARAGLLADQPIPAPNLARGRRRFLVAARPRPFTSLRLAGAILALLLVVLVATGVASADALPGDVLYPVKLGLEQAQLALTFDPAARERALAEQAARRRGETQAVLNLRRTTRVEFEGLVESAQEGLLIISSIRVATDQASEYHVADLVWVEGLATAEGHVVAERITLLASAPTSTPVPTIAPPTQSRPLVAPTLGPPTATSLPSTERPTESRPVLATSTEIRLSPTLTPQAGRTPTVARPTDEPTPTEVRFTLTPTSARRP